jgi:hypothetical protein
MAVLAAERQKLALIAGNPAAPTRRSSPGQRPLGRADEELAWMQEEFQDAVQHSRALRRECDGISTPTGVRSSARGTRSPASPTRWRTSPASTPPGPNSLLPALSSLSVAGAADAARAVGTTRPDCSSSRGDSSEWPGPGALFPPPARFCAQVTNPQPPWGFACPPRDRMPVYP